MENNTENKEQNLDEKNLNDNSIFIDGDTIINIDIEELNKIPSENKLAFIKDKYLKDESIVSRKCSYQGNDFKIIGASVIGKSHISSGTNRDDALRYSIYGDFIILTVSDGAGSKKLSKLGANYSTTTFSVNSIERLGTLKEIFAKETLTKKELDRKKYDIEKVIEPAFNEIRLGLIEMAERLSCSVKDLSCTLLTIIYDLSTGWMIASQIGDGLIVGLDKSNEAKEIIEPRESDAGYTYFITMSNFEDYLDTKVYSPEETEQIKSLFIMTDGVSDDVSYPPPEDILNKWSISMDKIMRKDIDVNEISEGLKQWLEKYEAKGSFDDRTLLSLIIDK